MAYEGGPLVLQRLVEQGAEAFRDLSLQDVERWLDFPQASDARVTGVPGDGDLYV
jgi:hypothetical protein